MSEPVPDDAVRTLRILAKVYGRAGEKTLCRALHRAVAILGGSPMSDEEAKSELGYELARQRRVAVRPRNSGRPKKQSQRAALANLSPEDREWEKKRLAEEEAARVPEEQPLAVQLGLVRP